MARASTYSFGASGVSFTQNEITAGSAAFSQENLQQDLGTEVAQGTFANDPGLTAFDYSPIFTADAGPLTATPNEEQVTSSSNTSSTRSTRPYIWKKSS